MVASGKVAAQDTAVVTLLYSTTNKQVPALATDSLFTITEIAIAGIRRTRKPTILREVTFAVGKTYGFTDLKDKLDWGQRQLMNTNLFRRVAVNLLRSSTGGVTVYIFVEEKWYFYPEPFVRIANGTFSQWTDRGRRLDHLNYGLKLTQQNFSGRGDQLGIHLGDGYTRRIGLNYRGFYFDKAFKWSGSVGVSHGLNREINYTTAGNKLMAIKTPEGFVHRYWQGSFDLTYRPAIKLRHHFSIGYNYNRIADTVNLLNENFSPSDNVYQYPYISYGISYIDYDFNPYPTRGRQGDVSLLRGGFGDGFNLWQLSARGTNYWGVGKKGYFSLRVGGTIKLPFKQPYINQGFLGHGDAFLQGYENYFADGVAGFYSKQTLGRNLLTTAIPLPEIKLLKNLRSIPIRVFAKVYTNSGYAYHPSPGIGNNLSNRLLYTGGFGLDIILFNDTIFKFEWSLNQLGQSGIFFHQ